MFASKPIRRMLVAIAAMCGLGRAGRAGAGAREGHLSVSGAADPAGVRADPACQGQGLFHGGRARRELRRSARGGVDVAKHGRRRQCTARRHRGSWPDHGPRQRRAGQNRGCLRRQGIHAACGARGFRHRKACRSQGQDVSRFMSYQDTTFYALLGLLASVGLTQNNINIQSGWPNWRLGIRCRPENRPAWPACPTQFLQFRLPA